MQAELCWAWIAQPVEPKSVVFWRRLALPLVAGPHPSVSRVLGRSRLQRPCSPGRLNCRGWAASSRLQRFTAGRRMGRCPRLQSLVREDPFDHLLLKPAAMIFSSPPQFGQCSRSISNTRLSSFAQLSRTGRWCAQSARGSEAHCGAQRPAATRRVVSQPTAVAPGINRRTAVEQYGATEFVFVASTRRNHWR